MYDRWVQAAVHGQVSGAVLLDLSAAFDLVPPDILLNKLEIYGLDQDFLTWIGSYLTDRLTMYSLTFLLVMLGFHRAVT